MEEVVVSPDVGVVGIAEEGLDVALDLADGGGGKAGFQLLDEVLRACFFAVELADAFGEVPEVEGNVVADVPFKVVPVAPFYPVFPCAVDQGVHFSCEEVGEGEAAGHEGVGQEEQALFRPEVQRRLGVDFQFDFDGFVRLKGDVVDVCGVFQESGFHFVEVFLVFFLDFYVSADEDEGIDDGLEVFCEVEFGIGSQQGEVHVFAETLEPVEDAEAGAPVEGCYVEEAAVVKPGEDDLLVDFKGGVAFVLCGGQVVCRKHVVVNLVVHFFNSLRSVFMDSGFFPTGM